LLHIAWLTTILFVVISFWWLLFLVLIPIQYRSQFDDLNAKTKDDCV